MLVGLIVYWFPQRGVTYYNAQATTTPVVVSRPVKQYIPPQEVVDRINAKIYALARVYDVDPEVAKHIVYHESRYNLDAVGDKTHVCKATGQVSPSYGMVQINLCYHNVTILEAHDEDFALQFLMLNLSLGKCYLWSTCPLKDG